MFKVLKCYILIQLTPLEFTQNDNLGMPFSTNLHMSGIVGIPRPTFAMPEFLMAL